MFEWKYSVNIASIDAQHQKLFAIADELHEAMRNGQAGPVLAKTLDRLVQYTKTHFANEEGLMKIHGYPGIHRAAGDFGGFAKPGSRFGKKTNQLFVSPISRIGMLRSRDCRRDAWWSVNVSEGQRQVLNGGVATKSQRSSKNWPSCRY